VTNEPRINPTLKSSTATAWSIAGLALFIFVFYLYHNPVRWDAILHNFPVIFYLFRPYTFYAHWGTILSAAWVASSAWGIGITLLRILKRPSSTLESLIEATAIGYGILSLLVFALALLQLLNTTVLVYLLITLTLLTLWQLYLCWPFQLKSPVSRFSDMSIEEKVACFFIALSIFYAFISALMPPTQSDGLRYHLTAPKLYLEAGGFYVIPNLSFANFPFLIDYLYAIPLALSQDSGAKLIHVSFYLLTLGLIYLSAKALFNRRTAIISLLLFSTIPFVPIFSSWSFIEFGLTTYTLLGLRYALALQNSDNQRSVWQNMILLGLGGGFMLGRNSTALATMGFLLITALNPVTFIKSKKWPLLFYAVMAGIVATIVASPWYIKNYLLFGDPLFPFAGSVFPTPGWSEFNSLFFAYHAGLKGNLTAVSQLPLWGQIYDFISLPFRLIFFPGGQGHQEDFGSWPLGSIWLVLGIMLIFKRSWQPREIWYTLFAFFLYIVWAYTYRDTRFLLPSLAAATPVLAATGLNFMDTIRPVRWLFLLKILYSAAFTTGLLLIPVSYGPWWVVSGKVSEREYLTYYNDFTRDESQAAFWLRDNTQPSQKVLLHGVDRPYYFKNEYIAADFFDTDPLLRWSWQEPDANALLSLMKEKKIGYMVYNYGKIGQYGLFYRFFRLPPEKSVPLLKEFISKEHLRAFDLPAYQQWWAAFQLKLELAEETSANVSALESLINSRQLEEVFRYDEDPEDPNNGIIIFRLPESTEVSG